jgi:hypothetical protein
MTNLSGRSLKLFTATLILAVPAVPAMALQSRTPDDGREQATQKQAERTMRDFARCVVANKKREAKAVEFLKLPDGDPHQFIQGNGIASSGCAPPGSQMRFQPDLFSRSIYAALYTKYYLKDPPADLSAIAPADYQLEYKSTTAVSPQQLALRTFADCTVRGDVLAAHNFAISEIQSVAEKDTVPRVVAAMQQCLETGSTLKFSRTILKGLVAESLYKFRKRQPVTEVKSPK